MNTEVVVSVLGIILSAILSLNLVNWRLKKLEDKVDEHNKYSDRFANMATDIAVIKNTLELMQKENNNGSNS